MRVFSLICIGGHRSGRAERASGRNHGHHGAQVQSVAQRHHWRESSRQQCLCQQCRHTKKRLGCAAGRTVGLFESGASCVVTGLNCNTLYCKLFVRHGVRSKLAAATGAGKQTTAMVYKQQYLASTVSLLILVSNVCYTSLCCLFMGTTCSHFGAAIGHCRFIHVQHLDLQNLTLNPV